MILPAGKWREHVSQKKNIAVSFTCVKEYDTLTTCGEAGGSPASVLGSARGGRGGPGGGKVETRV